jgi:hypothetical protein
MLNDNSQYLYIKYVVRMKEEECFEINPLRTIQVQPYYYAR